MVKLENVITGDRQMSLPVWTKKYSIDLKFAQMLLKSIKEPMEFIFNLSLMEKVADNMKEKSREQLRDALLRLQIWCSINSHNDPLLAEKQLFISQVMEKIFFESNLLTDEEGINESIKDDKE
ncbi:MAG: hypothetical protein JW716_04025 [Candidatus Aenigmarchaeota archaeon]|nr:hypothetical protein [Candidatus Aenigmarchaeota archaeon]